MSKINWDINTTLILIGLRGLNLNNKEISQYMRLPYPQIRHKINKLLSYNIIDPVPRKLLNIFISHPKDKDTKEINKIQRLLNEGFSFSEIGEIIGKSRSSIAGLKYRNKLKLANKKIPKIQKIKQKYEPKLITPPVPFTPTSIIEGSIDMVRITINALEHNNCHWPIGEPSDLQYCGNLIEDVIVPGKTLPYCKAHKLMATRK